MEDRRKNKRYDFEIKATDFFGLKTEVKGHFDNEEPFVLKNVGMGGFNIISNYLPDIGTEEVVYIKNEEKLLDFRAKIIYANIIRFTTDKEEIFKPGILYSIGCQIKNLNDDQKEYIRFLIQKKSDFFDKKKPDTEPE